MTKTNPYTLSFGNEPQNLIKRNYQNEGILEGFLSDNPTYHVCMITGIRGSGKTVALTTISNEIANEKEWIIVNLNPETDLLHALAADLANRKELLQIFKDAKINLSLFGLNIEIDNIPPITDTVSALRNMLKQLTKKGKKILVTIDEVKPSKNIKIFTSQFQIFIREKINIFLLMSGLYNHIDNLQNLDTLTFLQRAPKVVLEPLNITSMCNSYKKTLKISESQALELAKFTKGYAFAFQLIGYTYFKYKNMSKDAIDKFDEIIEEYTYNKIWSECSEKEKKLLSYMDDKPIKNEIISKKIKMPNTSFSKYRTRLIKSGIIFSPSYGMIELALPRFKEFIKRTIH